MARKTKTSKSRTNGWDFGINVTNKLFNLANSGNLIGCIVVGVILIIFFRYPPEKLPMLFKGTYYALFKTKYLHSIIINMLIIFLCITMYLQKKNYTKEIKRLTNERKQLIHGLKSGELEILPSHHTSGYLPQGDKE